MSVIPATVEVESGGWPVRGQLEKCQGGPISKTKGLGAFLRGKALA
jgi:hypothetical protein